MLPSISISFTYFEAKGFFLSLVLLKNVYIYIFGGSLIAGKGKIFHKLTVVKKNVSVKNTGNENMLQFKGENTRGS